MPSLNFMKQFVPAIENGLDQIAGVPLRHPGVKPKTQTIRAMRRDNRVPKVGETEFLFYGMQTKQCRRLGEPTCTQVRVIDIDGVFVHDTWHGNAIIDGVEIDLLALAKEDGFETEDSLLAFLDLTHGLPFLGHVIDWGPIGNGKHMGGQQS